MSVKVAILLAMLAISCGGERAEPDPHAGHTSVAPAAATDPHAGHSGAAPADPHAGHGSGIASTIAVSPDVTRRLGIRTEPAASGTAGLARRAPATVSWDPLALVRLTAQPGGQVRELRLPREGEAVQRGAVVARLYNPEIRAAFEELLVAEKLGDPYLSAARSRLLASGVSAGEIASALERDRAPDTYAVRAPAGGVVVQRAATEGAWIGPGGALGLVADPAALVVEAVVSGPAPATGTGVTLRDPASGQTWRAAVAASLPTAGAAGSSVRLLPQASIPVGRPLVAEWSEEAGEGVWIPQTALVDTGLRRVVFVALGEGRFEPRAVEVGTRAEGRVQVLSGLAAGEPVVVAGAFLLDSETQIGSMGHAGHGG